MQVSLGNVHTGDRDRINSILYQLLAEREEYESISHNTMPTYGQHCSFVERKPYKGWYLIYDKETKLGPTIVGSVYISFSNEIGIAIFKKHRRKGYAREAIKLLMISHPEQSYLANINPMNEKSIALFKDLGFGIIQETYMLRSKSDAVP